MLQLKNEDEYIAIEFKKNGEMGTHLHDVSTMQILAGMAVLVGAVYRNSIEQGMDLKRLDGLIESSINYGKMTGQGKDPSTMIGTDALDKLIDLLKKMQ